MIQRSIIFYINKLQGFKTALKNLHWSSKNLNEHELMERFEDIVSKHQDEVAEITQGIFHTKIENNKLQPKPYTIKTPSRLFNDVLKAAENVYDTIQKRKKYIGLRSEIEAFIGQVNKQIYLLDMCVPISESTKRDVRNALLQLL